MRICVGTVALLLVLARPGWADMVHYLGPHPVTPELADGMCFIEGPHLHSYRPHEAALYITVGNARSFVGDPTPYARQQRDVPRHAYYGHHPLFWYDQDIGEHYCYISGPHYHWYKPPRELEFVQKGGVSWWVGMRPPWYERRRHRRLDRYYRAHVQIERPVVTVEPPHGFVGVYVGPGGVHAGAGVVAPSVHINLPVPMVNVVVGGGPGYSGGGHIVTGRHRVVKRRHVGPPAWGHRNQRKGKTTWKVKRKDGNVTYKAKRK